jgi:hypothetical protein
MPESAGPVSGASNQERKGPSRGRIGEAANGYVPLAPRGVGLLNAESSWFNATSYPHNPHIHELGFVILFTRGAFGWMPLARSVYPQAPELWSLALSLGVALACAAVVIMVSEQGFPASGALLSAWNTTNISAPLLACEVPSKFLEIPSTLASSRTTKL